MAVAVRGAATDLETLQNAVSATGDGSALEVITHSVVAFVITGTFTATVTFQGTVDGTNYVSIEAVNYATGAKSTTATAAGQFYANCAGLQKVRATVTWSAGTSVTVKARGLPIPSGAFTADIDASGATISSSPSPAATSTLSRDVSGALEASSVTKASAGTLYSVHGYNTGPAQLILFYNSTTVPANGAVTPLIVLAAAADSVFSFDPGIYGEFFSTGIAWSNSTDINAPFTKTLGAADCFVSVLYV